MTNDPYNEQTSGEEDKDQSAPSASTPPPYPSVPPTGQNQPSGYAPPSYPYPAPTQQQGAYQQPPQGNAYSTPQSPSYGTPDQYQSFPYQQGQPQHPQPVQYYSQSHGSMLGTKASQMSIILGCIGTALWFLMGWFVIGCVGGVILGIFGLKKATEAEENNVSGTGGRVLSWISLIGGGLGLLFWVLIFGIGIFSIGATPTYSM